MTLTKQQDALATKLRDAGVPGAFAVLVASRAEPPFSWITTRAAVICSFTWPETSEDHEHWASMHIAWVAEFDHMETTGVRYDD